MITRWAGFVAVTLLAGCASRPYTAKKTEVAAKIESIRSAVKLANAAPAQRTYQPATLAPPPFVGGHRAGPQINATVLPVEVAAKLGTDQQPKRQGFFDTDDSWCIAEAASVVETGKFLEDTEGHTSANSQACADFVLRLRYLLVLKTRAYQADKVESYFIGSVTVVDLDAQKIVGAFDLETRDKGALRQVGNDKYGRAQAVVDQAAADPTHAAEKLIETELAARFTGAQVALK